MSGLMCDTRLLERMKRKVRIVLGRVVMLWGVETVAPRKSTINFLIGRVQREIGDKV